MMSKTVYEMSDDEIMDMSNPPETDETKDTVEEQNTQEQQEDTSTEVEESNIPEEIEDTEDTSDKEEKEEDSSIYKENNEIDDNSDENSDTIQKDTNNKTPNYEEFYKRVMAPFKANGKTIQLNSAEEAIALMQKGVDYTRKMQDIARYRKPMLMLERANLLNEDQISFFIDLVNGDQEAIRKLLKDKNIDAFSLPSEDEPINYVAGSHKISDEQINFKEQIDTIATQANGVEFLKEVNNYDAQSKDHIFKEPRILQALYQQKQGGLYDKIVEEIERQRVLGQIPDNVPFLIAYNAIGNKLFGQGSNNQQSRNGLATQQPLTRKPAITSNRLNNSQRAKSAGLTRTSNRSVGRTKNPLEMSDEEFLKQFGE